jgi:hypothetical protein
MRPRAEPADEVTHELSCPTTLIGSAYQTSGCSRMRVEVPFTANRVLSRRLVRTRHRQTIAADEQKARRCGAGP